MRTRTFLLVLTGLTASGIAWFLGWHSPKLVQHCPSSIDGAQVFVHPDAPAKFPPDQRPAVAVVSESDLTPEASSLAPPLELRREELSWERWLAQIIDSKALDNSVKARQLLDILPNLPEEALETATYEALSRLADKDYAAARVRLVDPHTHGMVLSVLFADLLERPDEIVFPALLMVARLPEHPLADDARANLELLLGESFGSNWPQWDAEIRRTLSARR